MSVVMLVARREWLELRRQPALLVSAGALFLLVSLSALSVLGLLELMVADPGRAAEFELRMAAAGLGAGEGTLAVWGANVVGLANFLAFTQLLGVAAVLSAHAMLHERQCGTLPYLLLSPVRRWQLLVGKVLGVMGLPLLVYLPIAGGTAGLASLLEVTQGAQHSLPTSAAWWMAYLLGAPTWAFCVATIGAITSGLSRDVRSAQQVVWVLVTLSSMALGSLLTGLLSAGAQAQASLWVLGLMACGASIAVGTSVLSREVGR